MILYYPASRIVYIYELNKLDNYRDLHQAAKKIMEKKNKLLWGYDVLLYKICKGKIQLIKKLYKEVKALTHDEIKNDGYERLRNKYDVKDITDCHFDSMIFNPFKIIDEYVEEDRNNQTKEFKKRCDVIERYLADKKFVEYLGNYKFEL
jgi:hypothetical protein